MTRRRSVFFAVAKCARTTAIWCSMEKRESTEKIIPVFKLLTTLVKMFEASMKGHPVPPNKIRSLITPSIGASDEGRTAEGSSSDSLIDESTDVYAIKQMCVVIRYPSVARRRVVTTFLGLVSLESGAAAAITEALVAFLNEQHLDPAKCVGLATDGCTTQLGGDQVQRSEPGFRAHPMHVPFASALHIVRHEEVAMQSGFLCG